jgi:hypothetical protein
MGLISTKLNKIRPKIVVELKQQMESHKKQKKTDALVGPM